MELPKIPNNGKDISDYFAQSGTIEVFNENLKEEVVVTVIATGFDETKKPKKTFTRPNTYGQQAVATQANDAREEQPNEDSYIHDEETLDIPTFLRNRNRNR